MYQVEYSRNGQGHLFEVETEALAVEWLNDLIDLAMISWVVVYRKHFSHREVIAVEDKTGKCPVLRH